MHLASGLLGVAAVHLPVAVATAGLSLLAGLALLLEAARFAWAPVRDAVARFGGAWFRPREHHALSGATWLALGYLATWLAFPPRVAGPAMTVAAVADPAAAWIGRRFGRAPGRKTLAGSLACFGGALAVLAAWGTAWPAATIAALAAAACERLPLAGADNVAVPLGAALALRFA